MFFHAVAAHHEAVLILAVNLNAQDGQAIYDAAVDASREHGGRVLVLDAYGTVQADSYSLLNGTQLKHPEVVAVLGGKASANGLYKEELPGGNWLLSTFGFADDASVYGLYVSAIVSGGRTTGALVYSVSEQELYSRLLYIRRQIVYWLLGVALATLITVIFIIRVWGLCPWL